MATPPPVPSPNKLIAKVEDEKGVTFNQVFYLSKNPDGTPRTRTIPVTINGPQSAIAETSKKRLFELLESKGHKVSAIFLRSMTMKLANGDIVKLDPTKLNPENSAEIKQHIKNLRDIYNAHLESEDKSPMKWSDYSENGRGDRNGSRCLDYSTSTRAFTMTQWPREKIVTKLKADAKEERSKKVDEFFTKMPLLIDRRIARLETIDPKEPERIQRLRAVKAEIERSRAVVTAAACLSSELKDVDADLKTLQEAFKTEDGPREEGFLGKLGRTNNEITDGEQEFMFDIALLRARTGEEYVLESTKRRQLPKQDCFESAIYNALFDSGLLDGAVTEEKVDKAIEIFCDHPSFKGRLGEEDLIAFINDFKAIVWERGLVHRSLPTKIDDTD